MIRRGDVVDAGQSGVIMQSGWFLPTRLLYEHPQDDLDFWRAWKRPNAYKVFRDAPKGTPLRTVSN